MREEKGNRNQSGVHRHTSKPRSDGFGWPLPKRHSRDGNRRQHQRLRPRRAHGPPHVRLELDWRRSQLRTLWEPTESSRSGTSDLWRRPAYCLSTSSAFRRDSSGHDGQRTLTCPGATGALGTGPAGTRTAAGTVPPSTVDALLEAAGADAYAGPRTRGIGFGTTVGGLRGSAAALRAAGATVVVIGRTMGFASSVGGISVTIGGTLGCNDEVAGGKLVTIRGTSGFDVVGAQLND